MAAPRVTLLRWSPAALLAVGVVFTVGVDTQRAMPLRAALGLSVPARLVDHQGTDLRLSAEERRIAGVTEYLMRTYGSSDRVAFSVYVGYYDRQTQGRTIHSPKNCLPGSGWEALASRTERIALADGEVQVNRYLIRRGTQRALVLYWYQGRGRVESNEYRVKLDLLRDASLRRRTEEALVRVVVPIAEAEEHAFDLGALIVRALVPAVARALPA